MPSISVVESPLGLAANYSEAILFAQMNSENHPCWTNETLLPTSDDDLDDGGVAKILWDFVGPIIFCIGILGNIAILVVMTRAPMRGTSTCAYLILMAAADLAVLITGMLPEWLEAGGFVTLKELHPAMCKIEKFLFYTSGDTAIWIRVQFTLDRFMAVCFPLHQTDCCLPWRAKYYALGALLGAVAKNAHVLFTRGAEYINAEEYLTYNCTWEYRPSNSSLLISNCGSPTADYKYFEAYVRPWIAFALVSILPFIIILFCNSLIIMTLVKVKSKHSEIKLMSATHDRNVIQMTAMCLSASFCFLICTAPSIILLIGKPYWNDPPTVEYETAKAVNNQLYYVNHSANFFLYCITGRRFREALVGICLRRRYSNIASSLRGAFNGSMYAPALPSDSSNRASMKEMAGLYRTTTSHTNDDKVEEEKGWSDDQVHQIVEVKRSEF